jgi:hypothetical protein
MKLLHFVYSRRIIIIFAFILFYAGVAAQDNNAYKQNNGYNPRGKVEAMRIAFITERLNLSPAEAKQFWPIYNNYRHDLAGLRRSFFPHDDGTDRLDAQGQIEFEQKKLDLKKSYMPEFERAIGGL